jgi:hypothetical protein
MNGRIFLTMMGILTLIAMSSTALSQELKSGTQTSADVAKLQQDMSTGAKFASPVVIKIPLNLANNSTKIAWSSPGEVPTYIVAGITNNGKLKMDVTAVSLTTDSKERKWKFAGEVMPGGDGIIVFGKFVELWIKCQNSTTKQYSTGTLEIATWIPQ